MSLDAGLLAEYKAALAADPCKFAAQELYIRDKRMKVVRFNPWAPQIRLFDSYAKARAERRQWRVIMLKARQWGGSTSVEATMVADAALWTSINAAVVSLDKESASHIMDDMFAPMLRRLDPVFGLKVLPTSSPARLRLNDGSQIHVFTANNRNAGHSYTLTHLHGSEVPRWKRGLASEKQAEEVLMGLLSAIPEQRTNPFCTVVLEGTADGCSGAFHDIFWDCYNQRSDAYEPFFVPFQEIPEYHLPIDENEYQLEKLFREAVKAGSEGDASKLAGRLGLDEIGSQLLVDGVPFTAVKWRRDVGLKTKCNGDPDAFKTQYPSNPREAFLGTGRPVFSPVIVSMWTEQARGSRYDVGELWRDDKGKPRFEQKPNGRLNVYVGPVAGHSYLLGVDASEGTEGMNVEDADNSCIQVFDQITKEYVAEFCAQPSPSELGEHADALGGWYNNAVIVVEKNGPGGTVLNTLRKLKYPRLYCRKNMDKRTLEYTAHLGFSTDSHTRSMLIGALRDVIRNQKVKMYSSALLEEIGAMQFMKRGREDVPRGMHDDRVIAAALCAFVDNEVDPYIEEPVDDMPSGVWTGKFRRDDGEMVVGDATWGQWS